MEMRGQIWSIDLAASLVIFFSIIVVVIFSWNYIINQNQEALSLNEIENRVFAVTDALIKSPGVPSDWTSSNVVSIGLASQLQENVLNVTKVLRFILMDYSDTKILLGLGNFNYQFQLKYLNGSIIKQGGFDLVKGFAPPPSSSTVVPIERIVIYRGMPARLDFFLWK